MNPNIRNSTAMILLKDSKKTSRATLIQNSVSAGVTYALEHQTCVNSLATFDKITGNGTKTLASFRKNLLKFVADETATDSSDEF